MDYFEYNPNLSKIVIPSYITTNHKIPFDKKSPYLGSTSKLNVYSIIDQQIACDRLSPIYNIEILVLFSNNPDIHMSIENLNLKKAKLISRQFG